MADLKIIQQEALEELVTTDIIGDAIYLFPAGEDILQHQHSLNLTIFKEITGHAFFDKRHSLEELLVSQITLECTYFKALYRLRMSLSHSPFPPLTVHYQ